MSLDNVSDIRETDGRIMTPNQIRARGWEYWQKIYTSGSQTLLDNIRHGYPDMGSIFPAYSLPVAYFAVSHVYGPLMSFFDVLNEMQTSFVQIAALIPGGHNGQLKGHLQGKNTFNRSRIDIGALNNGATKEEVRAVRAIAIRMCEEVGVHWKTPIVDLD